MQSFSPSTIARGPLIGDMNPELRRSRSLSDFDNMEGGDEGDDKSADHTEMWVSPRRGCVRFII